jgi:hypothetical protein
MHLCIRSFIQDDGVCLLMNALGISQLVNKLLVGP